MSKKRIKWTGNEGLSLTKAFDAFVISQMAKGVKGKKQIYIDYRLTNRIIICYNSIAFIVLFALYLHK